MGKIEIATSLSFASEGQHITSIDDVGTLVVSSVDTNRCVFSLKIGNDSSTLRVLWFYVLWAVDFNKGDWTDVDGAQ